MTATLKLFENIYHSIISIQRKSNQTHSNFSISISLPEESSQLSIGVLARRFNKGRRRIKENA
jgi:hypothetical protein